MANYYLLGVETAGLAIVTAVVIQLFIQLVIYPFFHPLSKFPGPYWAKTSRIWMAYKFWAGTELSIYENLHAQHGALFRLCQSAFADKLNVHRTSHPSIPQPTRSQRSREATGGV